MEIGSPSRLYPMQGFIGDNRNFELQLEAKWQLVELVKVLGHVCIYDILITAHTAAD